MLDAQTWKDQLPTTIQAVFILSDTDYHGRQHAQYVHQEFLAAYNLGFADVPLVMFDKTKKVGDPFTVVDERG